MFRRILATKNSRQNGVVFTTIVVVIFSEPVPLSRFSDKTPTLHSRVATCHFLTLRDWVPPHLEIGQAVQNHALRRAWEMLKHAVNKLEAKRGKKKKKEIKRRKNAA